MGVGGLMAVFGGRYRQVRLLGAGGMGEVWLALDEELGERPVAIKRMHSRMLADAQDVARFQREMRLAARMQHPNIMTLFTTGTDNGIPLSVPVVKRVMMFGCCIRAARRISRWNRATS